MHFSWGRPQVSLATNSNFVLELVHAQQNKAGRVYFSVFHFNLRSFTSSEGEEGSLAPWDPGDTSPHSQTPRSLSAAVTLPVLKVTVYYSQHLNPRLIGAIKQ